MKLYLEVALVAAGIIQIAAGLKCRSGCAACWKDGASGVDIKFSCNDGHCGDSCPAGYSRIHCAKEARCQCKIGDVCPIYGPCWCGVHIEKKKSGDTANCDKVTPNWVCKP
ncbi:hypothetical protein EV426DRAFT_374569 [Tirmania nivea]|nr:hypothetical protein EV426DRAFT_404326 [Tirmania nivea]KAF8427915.1 hypothetical protein EV426DRAFT_374569 [Tirmania nivea]